MSRPNIDFYTRLPLSSFSGVDNAIDLEGVLREFEYGRFQRAAIFCDQMLRDDRVSGLLETRADGLVSAPMQIKAADESRKANKVAEILGGKARTDGSWSSGLWEQICPAETIGEMIRWGVTLDFAVAEIIWTGSPKAWMPRIRVWHPQFVYWDWSRFGFNLVTGYGVVELPRVDEEIHSDGHWIIFNPHAYLFGWMRGMVRYLARPYIMRSWNYRDWARFNEKFGQPTTKGIVPQGADQSIKDAFKLDLINAGSDGVVIVERGKAQAPDSGYDVELIESTSSTGYKSFLDFKHELDADLAIAIIGQDLPSQSHGGGLGDGKAKSFELVRGDKRARDARIGRCIRDQLLWWWAKHNFDDGDLAPIPEWKVSDVDEEAEEAASMLALGQGIAAMKTAGAPIDVRTIIERAGYPTLTEEEVQAKADEAKQRMLQPGARPGQKQLPPMKSEDGGQANQGQKTEGLRALLPIPLKRVEVGGLTVAIENPKDSIRLWRTDDGRTIGSTRMQADYGYIEGHIGQDKEELDCYVGPDDKASEVYIVHQLAAPGYTADDEDKVHLCFPSADAAKANFLAHRNDGEAAYGGMTVMSLQRFAAKLKTRTGTGKVRATADVGGVVALRRRPALSSKGRKRASRYADTLASKASGQGADIMRTEIAEKILAALGASKSADDLRSRLKAIARNSDPKALAELVRKTRLMAHLAGRGEMVQDL